MPSEVTTPGSNNLPNTRGLSLAVICLVLKVTAVEALPFNSLRREPALENI